MEKVVIEVQGSGRHVHLCEKDLRALFGKDAELVRAKEMGAGIFCAQQRLAISGPNGSFNNVAILGPLRERTQVEVSLTDARTLGIKPPIRMSGDLDESAGCVLTGPAGSVTLLEGVIVAKRHIHFSLKDAEKLNIADGEVCMLAVGGDRELIFDQVIARVDEKNDLSEAHIDFDEINAAHLPQFSKGFAFRRVDLLP